MLVPPSRRLLLLLLLLASPAALATEVAPAATATDAATDAAAAEQTDAERWLDEVAPIITARERALFLELAREYQRRAFIDEFWRVRDPYPRTARNELAEAWPLRVAEARGLYGRLDDDRSRIHLVHGKPETRWLVECGGFRPAEIWIYHGSEVVRDPFLLIFVLPRHGKAAKLWKPSEIVYEATLARGKQCPGGHRLDQALRLIAQDPTAYERLLRHVLVKPQPRSTEWVDSFVAQSTDVAEDAVPLAARLEVGYPGRHQLRTVVQGIVSVPSSKLTVAEYAGYRSYELLVVGEVLDQDGALFDRFRYRYGFPLGPEGEAATSERLALAFQRYLRPGDYRLVLRVDDLNSVAAERVEQAIAVPRSDDAAPVELADPRTRDLFAEATAAAALGETGIRLVPPRGGLVTGLTRFDTVVSGDEIARVRFLVDDEPVVTKTRPPYNVELDLGELPEVRTLRVEAVDAEGREVAADELLLNAGGYRFTVKLVEPRRGRAYEKSLRARVEVAVPEGRSLDRVELFLDEHRVATLYQEPFVHPVALPPGGAVSYVRAVAYLPDGNSTEDLVFVNAPAHLEEIDVQMVELYTTVLDRQGRPLEGLGRDDFKVKEDGEAQTIARFERVEDLPVHVAVMIDNSASMAPVIDDVRRAALGFFRDAISPKDRAGVITFNSFPNLAVELTNDPTSLGSGLAGLVAEGQTALYDSLMFGLYYMAGVKGQRALLLLSDGRDEASRFDFDATLEYARRAGITIYPIGLRLADPAARQKLGRLADATGGNSFFLRDIAELGDVYATIQRELRSQYLIAYQSSRPDDDGGFRTVELDVDRVGAVAKTIQGYYP